MTKDEVIEARVDGFIEAKRRVVDAIDHRLNDLADAYEKEPWKAERSIIVESEYAAAFRELHNLRAFVKGMCVETDE